MTAKSPFSSAINAVDTTELPETNTTQDESVEEQDTKDLVEESLPEPAQQVENQEDNSATLETSEHEILQAESTPPAEMIQEMNNFLSESVSNSQGDAAVVISQQKNADEKLVQNQEEIVPQVEE